MEQLKELINDLPVVKEDFKKWFERIAKCLLFNYEIDNGRNKYRILEVEFYYHCKFHPDESTYGFMRFAKKHKKHVEELKLSQHKALTWFVHYSGLDLVIGNNENPGGILIRRIQKNDDRKSVYNGPLVSMLALFNQNLDAGDGLINLQLVRTNRIGSGNEELIAAKRRGIGANAGLFREEPYNFSIRSL